MGYTRYYEVYQKIDESEFEKFTNDCKVVCEEVTNKFGHGLAGWDGTGEPEFEKDGVLFNGIGDNSHETFGISKDTTGFQFTKTNRKPYDRHVLACLLLAKQYYGDKIRVSSDGDNDDAPINSLISELSRDRKIERILND
jgi:hypothetical protein